MRRLFSVIVPIIGSAVVAIGAWKFGTPLWAAFLGALCWMAFWYALFPKAR